MKKTVSQLLVLFLGFISFTSCHSVSEKEKINFRILDGRMVSDSIAAHNIHYKEDFSIWKKVYSDCLHDSLFTGAFYLGLGNHIAIGSIKSGLTS